MNFYYFLAVSVTILVLEVQASQELKCYSKLQQCPTTPPSCSLRVNQNLGILTNTETIDYALEYVQMCQNSSQISFRKVKRGFEEAIDHLDLVSDGLANDNIPELLAIIQLSLQMMFLFIGTIFGGTQMTIGREGHCRRSLTGCIKLMNCKYEDWDRSVNRVLSTGSHAVQILRETNASTVIPRAEDQLRNAFNVFETYNKCPSLRKRRSLIASCDQNGIENKPKEILQEFTSTERPDDTRIRRAWEVGPTGLFVFGAIMSSVCYVMRNADASPNAKAQELLSETTVAINTLRLFGEKIQAWEGL